MPKRAPSAAAAPEHYQAMIAVAAYYKAEQRGFAPGYEIADWLEAEREFGGGATAAKPRKANAKRARAAANGA
jgi:hypothetical protein